MANKSKKRIKHDLRVRCAELTEQLRLRNAIEYGRIHRGDEYRVVSMACEVYIDETDAFWRVLKGWEIDSVPDDIKTEIRKKMADAFLKDENGCIEYRMIPAGYGTARRIVAKLAVLKPKAELVKEGL